MNITALIAIAIVATVMSIILKQYKPEYSMFISIAAGIAMLIVVMAYVSPIFDAIRMLLSRVEQSGEIMAILLKSLGICYLTQIACDSCKDAGETAIAAKLELAGKVAILILALPLFTRLGDVVTNLIEM
ncbi:MAG: stage III sporulation protein AD [Clostridiales bacterium]|nr:stage III sporulation protein AD [Clostridiales bacterium]